MVDVVNREICHIDPSVTVPRPSRRLAVIFTPTSFSPLSIIEAANGLCEIIWIVDTSHKNATTSFRLMKKLGVVIDTCAMSFDELVDVVKASELDGIVTFTDDGQLLAAKLARCLGLPFHPVEIIAGLTDKVVQRTKLRMAGFPNPPFLDTRLHATDDEIESLINDAVFPVVVKPRRGSASRNTHRANDKETLREILRMSREEPMIVEGFLGEINTPQDEEFSDFVSVESVVLEGEVHHLAVTGRFPLAAPFRGSGMFIPSHLPADLITDIKQLAADAALALGVESGFMHTEIKVTAEGPRILEVNGRVGGGVPDILRLLHGPSIVSWRMRLALGLEIPIHEITEFNQVGFFLWHQPPIGARTIVSVQGLDALADLPNILEIRAVRGPGDSVDWREGGVGHVFGVGGVVNNYDELIATRHHILDHTSVEYGS